MIMKRRCSASGSSRGKNLLLLVVALGVGAGCAAVAGDDQNRIEGKARRVQELVPKWVQAGGDPNRVVPLGQQVDAHMKAGRIAEAEHVMDRMLAIVTSQESAEPPIVSPAESEARTPGQSLAMPGRYLGTPRSIELAPLPPDAAVLFWSTRYDRGRPDTPSLGPSELYAMNRGGGHVTQITSNNPQSYEHAAVSFDRKFIAANRYLKEGKGETGLWVIDLDRKTETPLVPEFYSAGNGGVDWSPNGFIYFSGKPSADKQREVFRIRPDGTELTQLTFTAAAAAAEHFDISVSEDGSLVACVRMVWVSPGGKRSLKTQIWVMESDGSNPRMVFDGGPEIGMAGGFPVGAYDPEISPDNRQVVFSVTNTKFNNFKTSLNMAHDLYVANLDGTGLTRVTVPGPICVIPDWHDRTVLYTEYNEQENFVGLVMMNPDGSGRRPLEPHLGKVWDGGLFGKFIPRS